MYENETFNTLSIFHEETNTNTALIAEQSSLLFIPKQPLVNLCIEDPIFDEFLHKKISFEFDREKLFQILSTVYSKEVDQDILREIIICLRSSARGCLFDNVIVANPLIFFSKASMSLSFSTTSLAFEMLII